MKNNKLIVISIILGIALICVMLLSSSCNPMEGKGLGGGVPGSGTLLSQTRMLKAFGAVTVAYPADVVVRQGAKPSVEITADDNLLPQLSSEVVDGRLTIASRESEWKARVNPSAAVRITITMPEPKEIELSAPVGTLEANDLQADTLRLVLSGGGVIKLTGLEVEVLDGVLSGAGDIHVAGSADEIKLLHSGMGNFNAGDLKSSRATVELSGMGDATVRVESELKATLTGAGSIKYYGQPRVEQNIKGAGAVKPAE